MTAPISTVTTLPDVQGEPAWELALLFPAQGAWSEEDYLALDKLTGNHYTEHGSFRRGGIASSAGFPALQADVATIFDAP